MSKNLLHFKTGLPLLSAILYFMAGLTAAAEDWVFEPVFDTETIYDGIRLEQVSTPFRIDQRVFVKAYSLQQKNETAFGIYEIIDGEIVPFFIADMNVPGTDYPFRYINSFDIRGNKLVFVGGGKKRESKGIYYFDGQTLSTVVNMTIKMPKRSVNFKVIDDVYFSGNSIIFTGGREPREGLFKFENGNVEILAHGPVQYWTKKKLAKMDHLRVRSIVKVVQTDRELIVEVTRNKNKDQVAEFYKVSASGMEAFQEIPLEAVDSAGFSEIGSVMEFEDTVVFYGYDDQKLGGLYKIRNGQQELIADNTTQLWPENSLFLEEIPGEKMKIGDVLNPAPEMEFKKSYEGFPFWRTSFSLFELEGMLPKHYIWSFYVGEEVFPIRPQSKSGELSGNIGRVIGAGIAAAIFGGGFIAPAAQNKTRLDVLRTQAILQGFPARNISWSNYFQTPLMAGMGGFSSNGESVVFHAVNLKGQQGLFHFKDGKIEIILNKGDLLPEGRVKHIYIAGDAFDGDNFIFWVELEEESGDLNQVLYTTKVHSNYVQVEDDN